MIPSGALTGVLKVRHLGLQAYRPVWQAMSTFTENREITTADELWIVQHGRENPLIGIEKVELIIQEAE